MRRYDTSIKQLMLARKQYLCNNGKPPVFLSDWDADFERISIPSICPSITFEESYKYYFWTDEENFRYDLQKFFISAFGGKVDVNSYIIGSNGTSCLSLSLVALEEIGVTRILAITPVYFSILNSLDELDFEVYEFHLSMENNFFIDIDRLEAEIKKHHIQAIIITNPLFGSGVELSENTMKQIVDVCNKFGLWILLDYIYGGMAWDIETPLNYVFNYPVYKVISSAEKFVWIESISKRVFLNGVKTALLFASERLIRHILRLSIFTVGSMCISQLKICAKLYDYSNFPYISSTISKNAEEAQRSYRRIRSQIMDTNWTISDSKSGYFTLIAIPKDEECNDMDFATRLLEKTGVLTTPHSRYLLKSSCKYIFRVNLLLQETDLLSGISKLKTAISFQ